MTSGRQKLFQNLITVLLVKKWSLQDLPVKSQFFPYLALNMAQKWAKTVAKFLGHNFFGFNTYKLHVQHSRLLLTKKGPRNDTRSSTKGLGCVFISSKYRVTKGFKFHARRPQTGAYSCLIEAFVELRKMLSRKKLYHARFGNCLTHKVPRFCRFTKMQLT